MSYILEFEEKKLFLFLFHGYLKLDVFDGMLFAG